MPTLRTATIRLASELPKGSSARIALLKVLSETRKVANRPMTKGVNLKAYRDGNAWMGYVIDAGASAKGASKFYEMVVRPGGMKGWQLDKVYGSLTDKGSGSNVRTLTEDHPSEMGAQSAMAKHIRKRKSRGYTDAFRTRPIGQYPLSFRTESPGFGHGTQEGLSCLPEMRNLLLLVEAAVDAAEVNDEIELVEQLEDARDSLNRLERSDMKNEVHKKLRGPISRLRGQPRWIKEMPRVLRELLTARNYLRRMMKHC
jgi:predicted DNA-binding WGR domain protein